ncbi:MAG: restriction endonuclease subunit S [Vagococcus sp.]|uniref:restriction endonuclease subunit S n=1 Tax=Vagococcus sp. TaxID=1933889 RepID=UPI002FCC5F54
MLNREMKDSGVEYIGDIPKNWKIAKFSRFTDVGMGQTILKSDIEKKGIPIYSATQSESIFGYLSLDKINNLLKPGDFIIPARGNSIGAVKMLKSYGGSTQTTIWVKIIGDINKRYLYYVALGLREYWFYFVRTAIPQITTQQVSSNKLPLPSSSEQNQIVNVLDTKINKIDVIVLDTQQSILELKKYKQSLITETVTKGLDKNAEMKDSGIEWVGKVPNAWTITKLNNLFEIKKIISKELGYDVLSVTQNGLKVKNIDNNSGQMSADYSKYQIVQQGDFVMNHMDLLTGWVDISECTGVTSPDYRVFKTKNFLNLFDRYYLYVFQICYMNKIFYGLGQGVSNMGRWRLQTDKFLNFYLPLPSTTEQYQIVEFLDEKTSKIDNLIKDKEQIIKENEDYKKSLIYEYVTGKKQA